MISSRTRIIFGLAVLVALASFGTVSSFADSTKSRLVDRELRSENIAHNIIGTDPVRKMVVYLPPGYDESAKNNARYPVIYFLPQPTESYRGLFDEEHAQQSFDRAIASGVIGDFILITVDMATPLGSSWYVNSPVTGNWEDFMIQELVPYIDANFRTLTSRNSRGIAGDFMGGYGALRFGMKHPDVFGSVYALHPAGAGSGIQTMFSNPDWNLLAHAKSLDDVRKDNVSKIFTAIYQASVPNVDKPPLYIDLQAREDGGTLIVDTAVTARLRNSFLLEEMIPQYADNLKSLRGLKFDWPRSDSIQDHVYSAIAFSHKLNEFGIPHEAEEYNGVWGDWNWGEDGRVYTDVLPFFQTHLAFEKNDSSRK
jgi:hypothetical protein